MDYTCENCTQRHSWDCDDGWKRQKCDCFELDESTLTDTEREMFKVMRQVMREKGLCE